MFVPHSRTTNVASYPCDVVIFAGRSLIITQTADRPSHCHDQRTVLLL